MEKGLGQNSVPPPGSIDKSQILDIKPIRCLILVFSKNPQAPSSGQYPSGFSPFFPFGGPHDSSTTGVKPRGRAMPTPIWSFRSPVGEDEDLNGNDGYSHKRDARSNPSRVKLQKIKLNHNFQVDMSGLVGIGPAQKYDGNQEVVNIVLMSFDSLRRRLCQLVDANELNMGMFKRTDLKAENGISQRNQQMLSQILANASEPTFHLRHALSTNGSDSVRRTHKCCVYIAGSSKYCTRLNSIQAYNDINRDVIGEASHLSGYSFSTHNNIIHPTAELGAKTTVGPHCMLGEGSQMGDKCSVKRSVIGRHCRIGANVKVVNSIVMNHVTISDFCSIQGSVICSNVQLQERAILKDCQVGAGFVVTAGSECKGEVLAKK